MKKLRKMIWARHVACTKDIRGAERVRKPGGKKTLGRPRSKEEINIKIDFQEVGWEHGLDWSC